MTIERRWINFGKYLVGTAAAISVWTIILAGAALLQPAGKALAVISPAGQTGALSAVVRAGGQIVAVTRYGVVAISDDPAFVTRLYATEALLVVPARRAGCGFGALVRSGSA